MAFGIPVVANMPGMKIPRSPHACAKPTLPCSISIALNLVIACIIGHGHSDAPDVIHPEELKYDHDERLERHSSARRIQNIVRSSSARKTMEKKRLSRSLMPAQDEHGHANPATIRLFTPTPLVHIHHHGHYSCSSLCICTTLHPSRA